MSHQRNGSVIVAMITMWMVQVTVDEIVDMVAVGYGRVATIRSVDVVRIVAVARMLGCAVAWISGIHIQRVFVYVVLVRMVQMTVVKIVDMAVMLDRGVAAIRAVHVGMIGVLFAF